MNYEVEKFFAMDFVQRCYTNNGKGSGHMIPGQLMTLDLEWFPGTKGSQSEPMLYLAMALVSANRDKMNIEFEKVYSSAEKCAAKTPWQLHKGNAGLETDLDSWPSFKKVKYWPVQTLMPALARVNELAHRFKADTYSTLVIIAILRYAQDKGHYPSNLDELIAADYLKELPMDPWSDKPLVYKRTDDGFILYGVGSNFKDDGGQLTRDDEGKVKKYADEGDWVFWPVQK